MDLFVDAIDSRLQPPEKYRKLLKSSEKRRRIKGIENEQKNEEEHNLESSSKLEKKEDTSYKKDNKSEEIELDNEVEVVPFLNSVIDVCTGLVSLTNQISGPKYRIFLRSKASSEKVYEIRTKVRELMEDVSILVRKMASNHVCDYNTNLLDVLCDEIEYGLKKHDRTKHLNVVPKPEKVPTPLDQSPASASGESVISEVSVSSRVSTASTASKILSEKELKKEMQKSEKLCLETYSFELDPSNYKLGPRPQDQWRDCVDNFSLFHCDLSKLEKFNKIEPHVTFIRRQDKFRYFHKGFVPKIYPKPEFLSSCDRDHPVNPHPYSHELNSLVWSEEVTNASHKGYDLLGGDGTLFKMTKVKDIERARMPEFKVERSPGNSPEKKMDYIPPKYKMVSNREEFDEMIEELRKWPIVSIDVEHYDRDTFRGFTCLIQLSSKQDNYIVDPFGIFGYIRNLNKVTTDPKILKVMHGANNDIIWLQRDFGVFVVNLFDTREAAKVLNLSEQSLSGLLGKYFGLKLNKKHQLSDWSKRPLKEDMLRYACCDSCYLIPLFLMMKNEILAKKGGKMKVIQVMKNSRSICLNKYVDKGIQLKKNLNIICKRNKIKITSLDFVTYNFVLNLIAFRNYAARKLDKSEKVLVRDNQISSLLNRLRSVNHNQLVSNLTKNLDQIKYEIPNLIKIKNSIEKVYRELHRPDLILLRPRSIQFVMKCLTNGSVNLLKTDEFEKLKHTKCIDNTLKVYNKFVADGLFNSISPAQFDLSTVPEVYTKIEKSSAQKRSLAEEANVLDPWKRKKINV